MQLGVFAAMLQTTEYKFHMHNAAVQVQTALFFVCCLDCSTYVGFITMKDAESLHTMLEAIYVHWPTLTQVVVYDNSCHALTYALNCEPELFRTAQWVIDATHFRAHAGRAYAFGIKTQLSCCKNCNTSPDIFAISTC